MYQKILVATNDSESAKKAVQHAIQLAIINKESVIELVYVVDPGYMGSDVSIDIHSEEVHQYKKYLKESEEMVKESNIPYKVSILNGFPGLEIVEHANKHHFDLVILGNRGLNALQQFILGSVSHKVAKFAKCPVLIVK